MDDTKQHTDSGQSSAFSQIKPKMVKQRFVGSTHKEMGPAIAPINIEASVADYVDAHGSEKTPDLSQELKEAGVTVENKERPVLNEEHKAAGVQHAKESVPIIPQTQSVQLPYTPVQIHEMKKTSTKEGKHWIAVFVEYLGKKLSLQQYGT